MSFEKFLTCSLFKKDISNLGDFSFSQSRIIFNDFLPNNKIKFDQIENIYKVRFTKAPTFADEKIPLILPIKEMHGLLNYTLNNLIENGATEHVNIIVLDDRSSLSLQTVCQKWNDISYVRCDYDSGFNYAMLANIGAFISFTLGFKEIIFWNSDMYLPDKKTLPKLITKHRKNKPVISGTKLVYPFKSWNGNNLTDSKNMKDLNLDLRGKVQYGSSGVQFINGSIDFFHFKRGAEINNLYVNTDKGVHTVTGAYSMMDLNWLIKIGGFNPSLAKVYNDIDICLRACLSKNPVHYYGKDTFLYHEESSNLNNSGEPKFDEQFNSDRLLFGKIWNMAQYNEATRF